MNYSSNNENNNLKPKMKMKIRPRQTILPKKVFVASAFLLFLFLCTIVYYFQFGNIDKAKAAVSGDYRSATTGNWNSISTWEKYDGTSWLAATVTPTSTNGVITIQNGHTVTVTASVTVDEVAVDSGGALVIMAGKNLTLANGAGTDLQVDGTLTIGGTLANDAASSTIINGSAVLSSGGANTLNGSSRITIENGGRYKADDASYSDGAGIWTVNSGAVFQHNVNGGNLPKATWNTGSTCEITGITNSKPGNITQLFYHVTWNCPNQTAIVNLQGDLTTVGGNFNFISSNSFSVRLAKTENYTLNIGGNFNVIGGKLYLSTKSTTCVLNVTGNFVQSGGTLGCTDISDAGDHAKANPVLNITGDFTLSGGTLDMNQYDQNSNGEGITTWNLKGNFTQTGGTLTETATTSSTYGHGKITFAKVGTQTFTKSAGNINNTIHFTVNSGAVLDMGTSFPTGNGSFTLASGGGLNMGSVDGITQTSSSGNVQVTGTRSFSTGGNYTYNGTASQVTGDGLPAIVNNLKLDNSSGLTISNSVAASNQLIFVNGIIKTTSTREVSVTNQVDTAVTGYSATNYVEGRLRRTISSTGSYDFPVGDKDHYQLINCSPASLTGVTSILGYFTKSNPGIVPNGLVNNGKAIKRAMNNGFWTLTSNAAPTGGTYAVVIYAKGVIGELSTDPADYTVLHRSNSSTAWELKGTDNSTTNAIIGSLTTGQIKSARNGLNSFSDFSGGSGGGSFPIQLIYFHAKLNNDQVDLSWLTGAEINNSFFTIERSSDGRNFEQVFTKPGAGNSTEPLHYSGTDDYPLKGNSYYRLKQTDFDGRFSYSDIKTIKYKSGPGDESALAIASIGPNPFDERFKVSFTLKTEGIVNFQLINSSGQTIFKDAIQANEGMNQYEFIDQKNLNKGLYFVNLIYGDAGITQKVIKK